jgi:hypothetical protein
MAAVDVSRVVVLTNQAVTLKRKGHWARAAEKYADAVAAAQALQQPDCLIVACAQASHAHALLGHAETAGVLQARRVELLRTAFLEVLPAAMATLQRRLAAGTLLPSACRLYEVAWCAAEIAHCDALAANLPNAAAVRVASCTAEEISAWAAYVGHEAYMLNAGIALQLCAAGTDIPTARMLNLPEATVRACSVFVESAFDMIIQLRTTLAGKLEVVLVRNALKVIEKEHRFCATSSEWHARILAAWRRLRSSGVLQRRGLLHGASVVSVCNMHAADTAAATAAACGLRVCALGTCGEQEVHASQFKRCGACSGVVYCCKEHQVQDWPAHKRSSLPRGAQGGGGDC